MVCKVLTHKQQSFVESSGTSKLLFSLLDPTCNFYSCPSDSPSLPLYPALSNAACCSILQVTEYSSCPLERMRHPPITVKNHNMSFATISAALKKRFEPECRKDNYMAEFQTKNRRGFKNSSGEGIPNTTSRGSGVACSKSIPLPNCGLSAVIRSSESTCNCGRSSSGCVGAGNVSPAEGPRCSSDHGVRDL